MGALNVFLVFSAVLFLLNEIQQLSASNCDPMCLAKRPKSTKQDGPRRSVVYYSSTRHRCRRFTFYGPRPSGNIFVTMNECEETCASCKSLDGEAGPMRNTTNVLTAIRYECGPANSFKSCSGAQAGFCCSERGMCSRSAKACGPGCQARYGGPCVLPKDNQCGPDFNKLCTGDYTGLCCSQYGNCGFTDAYCGSECQDGWGGGCRDVAAFVAANPLGPSGWPLNWDRACGRRYRKSCTGPYSEQCCRLSTGLCGTDTDHCLIKYCDAQYMRKTCASSASDTALRFG